MKDFLDSVTESNYVSGNSDTDESVDEQRKKEKKNIKKFISKLLCWMCEQQQLQQATGGGGAAAEGNKPQFNGNTFTATDAREESSHEGGGQEGGSMGEVSTISQPTSQMMDLIERLSIQAALVMTALTRKQEEESSSPVKEQKSDGNDNKSVNAKDIFGWPSSSTLSLYDDLGGSFSNISSKSSYLGHRKSNKIRPDGTHQEVSRVPGLEEESSVSTSSHLTLLPSVSTCSSSAQDSWHSKSTLKSSLNVVGSLPPTRSPFTFRNNNNQSANANGGTSTNGGGSNPVHLTPQMKGLIKCQSVKAALSVISQEECSLSQDAGLDLRV